MAQKRLAQLAQPSMTRFDRQELRNYMKEAEAALRKGFGKLVAEKRIKLEVYKPLIAML